MINQIRGNCIVGQSGGPTCAINASLKGILQENLAHPAYERVFGMINGIEGLLAHKYMNLSEHFKTQESLEQLMYTPAMFLGSCRYKLPHFTQDPTPFIQLFDFFKAEDIRTVFYIGGNDSMDTVLKLSEYADYHHIPIQIIGIPKTIDNDLSLTDHTPGYGSAAKYIASTVLEIAHDTFIYNIPSITIVEIMGRNTGWLTAASCLARTDYSPAPHLIYLPEIPFSMERFITDVKDTLSRYQNIIIAVSEGIKDEKGEYIAASSATVDAFGHTQLCGVGKALEYKLKEAIGCKVRSIEVNVLQRSAAHCSSLTDLSESVQLGQAAFQKAQLGETRIVVCYKRTSNTPYTLEIFSSPVEEIANIEKTVPLDWIEYNDVKSAFIDYAKPLILGEVAIGYANGVPDYCNISHLIHPVIHSTSK